MLGSMDPLLRLSAAKMLEWAACLLQPPTPLPPSASVPVEQALLPCTLHPSDTSGVRRWEVLGPHLLPTNLAIYSRKSNRSSSAFERARIKSWGTCCLALRKRRLQARLLRQPRRNAIARSLSPNHPRYKRGQVPSTDRTKMRRFRAKCAGAGALLYSSEHAKEKEGVADDAREWEKVC